MLALLSPCRLRAGLLALLILWLSGGVGEAGAKGTPPPAPPAPAIQGALPLPLGRALLPVGAWLPGPVPECPVPGSTQGSDGEAEACALLVLPRPAAAGGPAPFTRCGWRIEALHFYRC